MVYLGLPITNGDSLMEFPFSQIQWIWIGLGQLLRRDPSFRRRRDGVGRDDFF